MHATIDLQVAGRGGGYTVTADALDAAMAKYLPASPAQLRAIVEDRSGVEYPEVTTVSAFLVMLADFDHNVDSSPLSIDAARAARR